uniref:Uncharacterized protein n=1 Tax=Arundo donax TaxID=35708 RepID=A0A0A9HFY9_ARUDO
MKKLILFCQATEGCQMILLFCAAKHCKLVTHNLMTTVKCSVSMTMAPGRIKI